MEWIGPGVSTEVELAYGIPRMLREYYEAANCIEISNQMEARGAFYEENLRTLTWRFRTPSARSRNAASDAWWLKRTRQVP